MKVSGVYIVKNEEKNLRKSIESIQGVCDEIIVVDTGSTDGTVALAEELGARVEHFKWRDDFSAARNYAISHAKGEIIIFLDADEWFETPLGPEAIAYLEEEMRQGYLAFFCPHYDYRNNVADNLKYVVRAFRNFIGLRYINKIHEQLAVDRTTIANAPDPLFKLLHSGYDQSVIGSKISRNLEALERGLKSENNPEKKAINLYYLSRENNLQGNTTQAWEYLQRYYALYKRNPQFKRQHFTFGIAAHHLRAAIAIANCPRIFSVEECRQYVQAFIDDYPNHPVPYYHGATLEYTCVGNLAAAYSYIRSAEEVEAAYDPNLFPGDLTTYSSCWMAHYHMKGEIETITGNHTAALDSLTKALQHGADQAWNSLLFIFKDLPASDIIAYLEAVMPNMQSAHYEAILSKLLLYPQLKQVYQYFALKHIKATQSHSDMTAVLALLQETPSVEHLIKVAVTMLETDVQSANVLMCVAMMYAPNEHYYQQYKNRFELDNIMRSFYAHQAVQALTAYDVNLLLRASKIVYFLDDATVIERMHTLMDGALFARFFIASEYYSDARRYDKTLAALDFSIEHLVMPGERLACYMAIGKAYAFLGDYDKAVDSFGRVLALAPRYIAARQCLNMIRGFSPNHAVRIDQLLLMASPPPTDGVLH